jgi:hypothetical protein
MSMPTGVVCWVSSTIGVGIPGVISGNGISSTLMTSGGVSGCCSEALALLRGHQPVWFGSPYLGGVMVFRLFYVKCGGLCKLWKLHSWLCILYCSLFSPCSITFLVSCTSLYRNSLKLLGDVTTLMF